VCYLGGGQPLNSPVIVKVKDGKVLPMPKHHAVTAAVGVELQHKGFLTSTLDGTEWSASRSGRVSLPKKELLVPIGQMPA
jgi:hypothetical protein